VCVYDLYTNAIDLKCRYYYDGQTSYVLRPRQSNAQEWRWFVFFSPGGRELRTPRLAAFEFDDTRRLDDRESSVSDYKGHQHRRKVYCL
jgi:hypothetical protein